MTSEDFHFEADSHSYIDGGHRVPSVTQVIKLAGLISYDGVPPEVLENARRRGSLVHELTAEYDRGLDVESEYKIPEMCVPYFAAWKAFRSESGIELDPERIEQPMVATISGFRIGMTPDRVGLLNGLPTVVEIKNTAAKHPAWGIQTAGYEAGLPRPEGHRVYDRIAVQLLPTGRYKVHTYDSPADFSTFCSAYTVAAFKLKHQLAAL